MCVKTLYTHPLDALDEGRVGPIFLGKALHNFSAYWLTADIAGSFCRKNKTYVHI